MIELDDNLYIFIKNWTDQTKLALVGFKNYKPILWLFSDFSPGKIFSGKKNIHRNGFYF
ncbi:MAG: hypothetical protein L3J11_11765 [Draconibacterium sp.]|nr:hypothetical protein [Draconibacterium sp.]